jgi:NAD(P)-dependent dehydrogenase (short-subunit alcohol dehydrogenase family)
MSADVRFDGRVAVVTGAGRGLGREFALELARRGAAVVVNDIGSSADEARYGGGEHGRTAAVDVAEEITAAGGTAVANLGDVSDPDSARSIVNDAISTFQRIDIIVNNAGVVITNDFADLTLADLDTCLGVHVRGAFLVSQAAWPYLAKAGYGRILNVCSVDGVLFGNRRHTAYDAAKGGLAGLTRGMAADGRELGIHVNGLLPGAMTRGHASVDHSLSPSAAIEMRPELVAPAAAYLVHEDCPVTGRFYAASSGRMGLVFTAAAEGFQAMPGDFSLESVRDHWAAIDAPENFVVPATTADYNEMRTRVFRSVVPAKDA